MTRGMTTYRSLDVVAPAFMKMAHRIVWCSVATVDAEGRPWSRVLHPMWTWDGVAVTGWVATSPTPIKRAHLAAHPFVSCSYWTPDHDTAQADCRAEWVLDQRTRSEVWERFASTPEPLGYDPGRIGARGWETAASPAFAVLRLTPWRLRVLPGVVLRGDGGELLRWRE